MQVVSRNIDSSSILQSTFSALFIFNMMHFAFPTHNIDLESMVLKALEVLQAFAFDPSERLHVREARTAYLTLRMVTFSLLISRAVSKHALTPLEILLLKVRRMPFSLAEAGETVNNIQSVNM